MNGKIADPSLATGGRKKIEWVKDRMPVMKEVVKALAAEKLFSDYRVGISIHLEAKTARLALAVRDGGAEVFVTSSNPLSTQDDVAAALNEEENITVYARRGVNEDEYREQLDKVLEGEPEVIIDDGGDLVKQLHGHRSHLADKVIGGAEETTTGVTRLKALDRKNELSFPMFAVNDAKMKYLFDNRYGTGQSTWDALMRTTNLTVAGSVAVVVGYGWCGRGIAMRADGLGADVVVVEVDPIKALEARMDGYRVMNIEEAAPIGDFFVTSTGDINAIPHRALEQIKDGAILSNAGHFDVEIDLNALADLAVDREVVRENIERYKFADGRSVYVIAEGRLVNLAAGDGHPAEIMDISFALQALTAKYIVDNEGLEDKLYAVPEEVDKEVGKMKLASLGIELDQFTEEQKEYLNEAS